MIYHSPVEIRDRSFWLPYRKGLSERFLPEPLYIKDLYYKAPFWQQVDIVLTSQQTLETRQTARYRFWLLALTGSDSAGNGLDNFMLQIFHADAKHKFSRTAVDVVNGLGTAKHKYWLRRPYRFEQGDTIIFQAKNLTKGALTAHICMEGVNDVTASSE